MKRWRLYSKFYLRGYKGRYAYVQYFLWYLPERDVRNQARN
jgi:hypothetical protein